MPSRFSRRRMMQGAGVAALAQTIPAGSAAPAARTWPIEEGPDTPKLCLAPGDGGGPLPAPMEASSAPQSARGRSAFGGNYGGFLAAKTATPPAPPAINTAYQRIRQLGVTHLLGVGIGGGMPWTVENVRKTVETAKAS